MQEVSHFPFKMPLKNVLINHFEEKYWIVGVSTPNINNNKSVQV